MSQDMEHQPINPSYIEVEHQPFNPSYMEVGHQPILRGGGTSTYLT